MTPRKLTAADFWARVDKNGPIPEYAPRLGPCWIWNGPMMKPQGYGRWRQAAAHRFAWSETSGTIPAGFDVDHLCRVRECVNPAHLEAVPHAENLRRGLVNQNVRKTHCPQGHEYTPENIIYDRGGRARNCRICRRAYERRVYAQKRDQRRMAG